MKERINTSKNASTESTEMQRIRKPADLTADPIPASSQTTSNLCTSHIWQKSIGDAVRVCVLYDLMATTILLFQQCAKRALDSQETQSALS